MKQSWWQRYIFPNDEAKDPEFREELSRVALVGFRVVAGITLGAPLLFLTIILLMPAHHFPWSRTFTYSNLAVGSIAFLLSFRPQIRRYARLLGCFIGLFVALSMVLAWLSTPAVSTTFGPSPAPLTSVLLIGVVCLPLKPIHTFLMGAAMSGSYLGTMQFPGNTAHLHSYFAIELAVWVVIATVLTAIIYAQRSSAYHARRDAMRSFEDLRQAQARLLLSENAAAQVRLAAALSHELNSPLGALCSAMDTLLLVAQKLRDGSRDADRCTESLQSAGEVAQQSSKRLADILGRMKRFTNLDRAEVSVADVNELLKDSAELLPPEIKQKPDLRFDLQKVPPFKCKPQQLSALFSNLLSNAAAALERRAAVCVSSRFDGKQIVIRFQDEGRGISKDHLEHLFEPALQVKAG